MNDAEIHATRMARTEDLIRVIAIVWGIEPEDVSLLVHVTERTSLLFGEHGDAKRMIGGDDEPRS